MNTVYASDLMEILSQYTTEELKKIKIFINNETYDDITLEKHDAFKVQDIEVNEEINTLYLEI
jgi:hypothetical protein